jgi:rfaE bifunctional protein kinase chain/domain
MSKFKVQKVQINDEQKNFILQKLSRLQTKKLLVLGDVGLDEYILGEVRRISPEAPVPVLEVEGEDQRLGLAANVAQNIVSLGGIPSTVSVVGQDTGAQLLQDLCKKNKVPWDGMIVDSKRPTTRKTRVMAKHHHLVRVDYEIKKYLSAETEAKVLQTVEKFLPQVDGVILEDYAKGVVSPELIKKTVQLCRQSKKPLFVDPHRNNVGGFYSGVDLIKPNYDEAFALAGMDIHDLRDNPDKLYEVGRKLQEITGAKQIVITRGKDGMTIFSGDEITEVPTYAQKVFDVTGAGDTVIAAMALGLVAGFDLVHACMLANFAAGVVVGKVGCVPCEISELKEYITTSQ